MGRMIRASAALIAGGAVFACSAPPPITVPSAPTVTTSATASAAAGTAAPATACFAPPPPTYLPWGAAGAGERVAGDKGAEYTRYSGPLVAPSVRAYFSIARAPADRLFPIPAIAPRAVSGRQVVVHRIGDPGVGEVGARWQEGMDGCWYDAHLYFPSAGQNDEAEIAKIIASLDVWAAARAQLPSDITVLRPGYLPARFSDPPWLISLSNDPALGPRYYIGYAAKGESLIFYLGPANSAAPTSKEDIAIRGARGTLSTTASWPAIQVEWLERGRAYIIQDGSVMTRDELVKIVAGLVEVR
jgi:hypothetical protein